MEDLNKAFDKKFKYQIIKKGGFEEDIYFDTRKIYPEIKSFIRQREKDLLKEQLLELEQTMKVKINPTTPFRDIRYWIQDKLKELSNE